ncbi:hypothetical protein AAZX31_19G040800 [Glycine max]|uniref:MADS-box domain-containing protein n=2 Tax=Glycine subgen. Soja TaxID=1462606 RepID=K7MWJ8_SOYBN|nr:uncharacterized protein LOC114398173 [Glycine soja]XP_040868787.1 uncharacterized protein LOC106797420 [Glycine max]KAG4395836.1 hypothetical protein GLYMA_19G045900v4 [Glycine max]KAG4911908.1 hypothetical protein JHK86_052341 [Glycine max]KAG4914866.1 hypothetical protein JHK87_052423 [Glycine soja]KAG4926712.1 hypothetical protein JHK85_053198 [Glycine max]KAG5082345.1 hypothetical protein JHK84_052383 [Glycine max]|eukprot:XP_014627212.1 uncharacterized protein LOC106797420 [Glycine max]
MGRARITLKLISNERSRRLTFKSRREILIKKTSEFSTLCGVEACLIVYDNGNGDVAPVTWPKEPVLVHPILQKYESQKNERPPKTFGIEDFLENRKNMVEADISKVHKQISNIKYPTWDPSFTNMEEKQLKAFITQVNAKIMACDHVLQNKHQSKANNIMQNMAWGSASSSHIPSQITPTPNNNGRVYVTNPINQFDGASNHGMNMQQVDACYGYIPTMAQESTNSTSSYPRQFNCLQNIPQSQPIFEDLKPLDYKNEMVDFSYQVDVPLDSTNQLGVYADWTNNQFGDFEDWINRPIDGSNQPVNGDLVGLDNKPNESILQNIPVQYQNKQQGGALHVLPPPLNGFQTDCYNVNF